MVVIILVIMVVVIVVIGSKLFYQSNSSNLYYSQEECDRESGGECVFSQCERDCPWGLAGKGWAARKLLE